MFEIIGSLRLLNSLIFSAINISCLMFISLLVLISFKADTVTVTDETIVPTVIYRWNQSDWVTRSIYGTGVLIIILVLFHISISVLRCVKIKGTLEDMQSSTT